ncbi:MAG: serine hydrolase domain-containing protein [Planctomycetota bacterium]
MRTSKLSVLVLGMLLLLGSLVSAQTRAKAASELEAGLRNRLEKILAETPYPGLSFAASLSDGTELALAVGLADRRGEDRLTPEHRMPSGSIGKTWVAAILLQLCAEDVLSLDDPVSKWLGDLDWYSKLPNAKTITVRSLARHTSGIPEHVYDPRLPKALLEDPDRTFEPEELVAFILDQPAHFEADQGWSYADTNYIVLGMVIEAAAKKPYEDLLRERLLKPCGLDRTEPALKRRLEGLAGGHVGAQNPFGFPEDSVEDGAFVINPQFEWTGGGIVTTPRQLARWGRLLLTGDVIPESLQETHRDGVAAKTGPGDRYAIGLQIRRSPHGEVLGHSGFYPGTLSELGYYRDHDLSLALQGNSSDLAKIRKPMRVHLDALAGVILEER